jgi:hypothetical protein
LANVAGDLGAGHAQRPPLDRTALKDFDPGAAGFATAQKKTFENIQVEDGALEVELIPVLGDPRISALEIEQTSRR